MDVGYLRETKSGPPEPEQRAACVAAGVDPANPDAWYVEPKPKRNRPASFEERGVAIRQLRPGDRLVIHSAPRLGATEAEIRNAAAAVSAHGAVIFDCSTQAVIRFHPDAGALLAWAKAGAEQAARERLGKARQGIKRYTPPKALSPAMRKRALELWPDLDTPVSAIAREIGCSVRTLYRHMPRRKP